VALLSTDSREGIADVAVRHVRAIVPVPFVSLIQLDGAQAVVLAAFAQGEGVGGTRWERASFGPIEAFSVGGPAVFDDLAASDSLPPALGAMVRGGLRSVVELPLLVDGEIRGLLVAGAAEPRGIGADDIVTLAGAAELIGPALVRGGEIERSRAAATRSEQERGSLERAVHEQRTLLSQVALSHEQERQRLAMDIHDDSVQVMTAATMRIQTLRERVEDSELGELLDSTLQTVRLATQRLRHLMFELVPPTLEREGLGPALSLYLERVRDEHELPYVFESRVHGHAPAETRTALYRIAQEAVRNVVEHARAGRLEVLLDRRDGGVWLRVADNGRGFSIDDVESRLPLHLGLTAMRQHAELADGWCRIRSAPGGGTTVEAWVPGEMEPARTGVTASTA